MSKGTKIAWAKNSFNPWWGCSKVSRACKYCYAASFALRMGWSKKGIAKGKFPIWGQDTARRELSDENRGQPLRWDRDAAATREFTPVFGGSMCDVFEVHEDTAWNAKLDALRARYWDLIEATPHLTWLLLTKRPQNILKQVPARWLSGFPSNVWIGTTTEDQKSMEERGPLLAAVPAKVKWMSVEPQVEDVNLGPAIAAGVTWVVTGGESGPGATPYDLDWARSIIRQCREAGIVPFVKQLGEVWGRQHRMPVTVTNKGLPVVRMEGTHGDLPELWPEDLRVREYPFALARGENLVTDTPAVEMPVVEKPAEMPPKKGYAALPFEVRSATAKKAWETRRRRALELAPPSATPSEVVPPGEADVPLDERSEAEA